MSKAKILWIFLTSTLVIILSIRHAKDINFDKSSKPFSAIITDKICLRAKGMQSVITVDFENIRYSITSTMKEDQKGQTPGNFLKIVAV